MPADGTYVLLSPIGDTFEVKEVLDIKYNKKTKENGQEMNSYYNLMCYYDYHSKLFDMNKPIDGKKIIQSNNFLSFFIKKESLSNGKLTEEIIDGYYNVLLNPKLKYMKPKAKSIYESVEEDMGFVDNIMLEKVRVWIKSNIFYLEQQNIITTGKDYLKLFFQYEKEEDTKEQIEKEGRRYLIPNIYNNNDSNLVIEGETYGLPNDNMGLNGKKPFLENKSRRVTVPHLINKEEVLLQRKFFDYLMNLASDGKVNIYIDYDKKRIYSYERDKMPQEGFYGMFLRIKKGKEVEIQNYEAISDFKYLMDKQFHFQNILKLNLNLPHVSEQRYGSCNNIEKMQYILNEVMFSKYLVSNYFTEAKDIKINDSALKSNLLLAREGIFNWIYKGNINGIAALLDKVSWRLVISAIDNNYFVLAIHRFNLRWSLNRYFERGIDMEETMSNVTEMLRNKINAKEDFECETEEEFYFAVGQVISYLLSLSKQKEATHARINPILNSKNEEKLKSNLCLLFKKYNYAIARPNKRFDNLYRMVSMYHMEDKVNQDMIIAGYLSNNLIYEKAEGDK